MRVKNAKIFKIPITELSKSKDYLNEKACSEEYRNCIREIMGDESIDIIISELKKEGAISHSFKPDYEKIRRLVESKILEGYISVVSSRPFIKAT